MTPYLEQIVIAAMLAFCRIGSCFMIMPGLSSARVPAQVRIFVAIGATAALLINLSDQIMPLASRQPVFLAATVVSEILTGSLIGALARIYLMALQFMGAAIGMLIGFGNVSSPGVESGEPEGPLGALISFSALMLLFTFDFHHEIVKALVQSYKIAPLGALFDARGALNDVTDTISESFFVVLRLGSPFVAYAILMNLTVGFVNKLVPQIPVYFISQPIIVGGGIVLIYFGIATMLSLFADGFLATTIGR